MKLEITPIDHFTHCMSKRLKGTSSRAIALLYFYAVQNNSGANLKQICADLDRAGLGQPNITRLRTSIMKDRRTIKCGKDEWRFKSDAIAKFESTFLLNECFEEKISSKISRDTYVNKDRIDELKKIKGKHDFTRLIQMLLEINDAFSNKNYISVILLVRAILDHIPPIFGCDNFAGLANNYCGSKSFKESMQHLGNSSRKIADSHLHVQIRQIEILPNNTQVDFSNDLDVLLGEILRLNTPSSL